MPNPIAPLPFPQAPHIKSIPESFFDSLQDHIQELEQDLEPNQQIALVYTQTGEFIAVERISYRGMGIEIWGRDATGVRTSVFANMSSFQMAFKVIEEEEPIERKPIGFEVRA